jgi:hypothetical protein
METVLMISSWLNPKACPAPAGECGIGVFCLEPILKEEAIAVFGGNIIRLDKFAELPHECQDRSFQIAEHLVCAYLCPSEIGSPADFINHSCEPNAGWRGMIELVAMRDIHPQEQITFDYATCLAFDFGVMNCHCGSAKCRGVVTGDDWRMSSLRAAYLGYFQPFLNERIRLALADSQNGNP